MRKILIDKNVKAVAEAYKDEVHKHLKYGANHILVNPEKGLEDLRKAFKNGKVQQVTGINPKTKKEMYAPLPPADCDCYERYLLLAIYRYKSDLLTATPKRMAVMQRAFSIALRGRTALLDKKLKAGGNKSQIFHNMIVTALRYDSVRQYIYPRFIRRLGVKSCVYCNANYTVTDYNNMAYYTVDHWKPKSKYPFLAISFFNLVPCCFSCNRNKGDFPDDFFGLYADAGEELDVLHLNVSSRGITEYIMDHDVMHLDIELKEHAPIYKTLRDNMDNKLHITRLYAEHRDIAEETLWRKMVYDRCSIEALKDAFEGAQLGLTDAEVMRFLYGTYQNPDDLHRRPLSRLIQDILASLS